MQILNDSLYILIEGEPNSPEVPFMDRVIANLISEQLLAKINYIVLEVGGSGNFNSVAKIIYNKSNLHQSIPVIAIADKDFITKSQIDKIKPKTETEKLLLIDNKSVQMIYWDRHEWENFMLEEMETMANFLNQIPAIPSGNKPFERNHTNILTTKQLNE